MNEQSIVKLKTTKNRPQAVHFGAGNIGRGLIGTILTVSGYEVCFVTRNKRKIDELNIRNEYPVNIANEAKDRLIVQHVKAISSQNKLAVAKLISEANLITTAIGVSNLSSIAENIALGLQVRMQNNTTNPLYIIACENTIGASTKLKKQVFEHLPEPLHKKVSTLVSFPNTVVDRIVPAIQHEDPLEVTVESYYEWVIEGSKLPKEFPTIKGVQFVDSLESYIERKLFTVNTGHCCAAYYGYLKGYSTIQEVMTDPQLFKEIQKVMYETGHMLIEKYDFDESEHAQYIHKILKRFANPNLKDKVVRVGKSPIRKLSKNDRLVNPTVQAYDLGIDVSNLTKAIAAALLFDYNKDPEAVKLNEEIEKHDINNVISKYLGIPTTHPIHHNVAKQYKEFKNKYQLEKKLG